MLLMHTAALPTMRRFEHRNLARLVQPREYTRLADTPAHGLLWAADNDCFNGELTFIRLMLGARRRRDAPKISIEPNVSGPCGAAAGATTAGTSSSWLRGALARKATADGTVPSRRSARNPTPRDRPAAQARVGCGDLLQRPCGRQATARGACASPFGARLHHERGSCS